VAEFEGKGQMKILTYVVAMLALVSGAAWSWEALVGQVPPAKIASLLPAIQYDASPKAEAPAAQLPQDVPAYARFVRLDSKEGPTPIYPASPGKELLGTLPPLPRAVVARQKALAKLTARDAMTAMAKASPREAARTPARTRVATNRTAPAEAASARVSRSYQSSQPLQLHPQRGPETVASGGDYRREAPPRQVLGFAEERRPSFLEVLLN
jgi:hypothetical protein